VALFRLIHIKRRFRPTNAADYYLNEKQQLIFYNSLKFEA